ALGNGAYGLVLLHASHNIVGTNGDGVSDSLERNVVSGQSNPGGQGIHIENDEADFNWIAGNLIGTDIDGIDAVPNRFGISMNGGIDDTIIGTNSDGVADLDEANVISKNLSVGILMSSSSRTRIQGNRIAGNGINGIQVSFASNANLIGSDADGTRD